MSKFLDRLQKTSSMKESLLCIGLDPDPARMPSPDVFEFCKTIVDSTQSFTAAYKPNMGFFEAFGMDGLKALEKIVEHIRTNYPEIFLIGDGKRGDIGSTSSKYAHAMFNVWDFDAVTVVIPGSKSPGQVHENASASQLPNLSKSLHTKLNSFYNENIVQHIRGKY